MFTFHMPVKSGSFFSSSSIISGSLAIARSFDMYAALEKAKEGMPFSIPSMAAPTVPEYIISKPLLYPQFMPEKITSGFASFIRYASATLTQSAGVPPTEYAFATFRGNETSLTGIFVRRVMRWLMALHSSAGATTHISLSPGFIAASVRIRNPGAFIPSSFVISIRISLSVHSCIRTTLY